MEAREVLEQVKNGSLSVEEAEQYSAGHASLGTLLLSQGASLCLVNKHLAKCVC